MFLLLFIHSVICGRDDAHAAAIKCVVVVEASHLAQGLDGSFLAAGGAPLMAIGAGQNDAFRGGRGSSSLIGCGIHRSISPGWIDLLFLRG